MNAGEEKFGNPWGENGEHRGEAGVSRRWGEARKAGKTGEQVADDPGAQENTN